MSDWLEFRCVSHNPHIMSDNICRISEYAEMEQLLSRRDEFKQLLTMISPWEFEAEEVRDKQAAVFFHAHPECDIEIWDEYGKGPYPLEPEEPPKEENKLDVLGKILSHHTSKEGLVIHFQLNDEALKQLRIRTREK